MNEDIKQLIQSMELEKTKGQLKSLEVSVYNPLGNNERYYEIKKIVDKCISDLENYF